MDVCSKEAVLSNGIEISLESGRLARQADGAVLLTIGETMLLATVVSNREIKLDMGFFPLSVDYKENYSSTGKIPGGFFKRDGKLNEYEILSSRIVDRSLRPMFPEDYFAETQVIISLLSSNKETMADCLACVAASAAITISDIPFPDPVSTVRVIYKDEEFIINPTVSQLNNAQLELIVAGTNDSINMVEGEMLEVSEEIMMEALKRAHEVIKELNQLQLELKAEIGKETREYLKPEENEDLKNVINGICFDKIKEIYSQPTAKQERREILKNFLEEVLSQFSEDPEYDSKEKMIKTYFEDIQYVILRDMILKENRRIDGREPDEIRPIWCETSLLPRAHGSALFTRGETQSLSTVTLGSKLDEQTIDYATVQGSKKFMLQYNFPPFSTGETKPLRGPGRREIGHGNLAERALKNMIPADNEYTIRLVSDVLESNGSSSMATVCAGTMALMDAGINITRPVSGIAMGLIVEGEEFAILSDILGDEDHLGDMDFKVTGTTEGLTACQMDIKVRGLSYEILSKALMQANEGRRHILNEMMKAIEAPREDISLYAPRLTKFTIPIDTIGAVIGPGGKVIQEIQRTTGTTISIEEANNLGYVSIASANKEALETAYEWVQKIVTVPTLGEVYNAKVKNIVGAGAFLEFLPGKDGWLHISEISNEHVSAIEDVFDIGEEVEVKLIDIDQRNGKYRLSIKALTDPNYVPTQKPQNNRRNSGKPQGGNRNSNYRSGNRNNDNKRHRPR